jgi:hypothetical protein
MTNRMVTMSQKEINRLKIIQTVVSKQLTQADAAKNLNVTTRQVGNLKRRFLLYGAEGLVSKHRGKPSNNRLDDALKSMAIELIKNHYSDFRPTLACEKLLELHQLKLSKETVRKLMIEEGLWHGKKCKPITVHPQRTRREAFGELAQIDGSPHAWFEERNQSCCLLVAIDDATGKLLALRFEPVETTQGYFRLFKAYLKSYGRPLACYHDKHGIFQVNIKEAINGDGATQFGRAIHKLGIESISANTPQAKGRVERVNQTLQDRLVKELRLRGISDIDSANDFLPQYIKEFNQKFAVKPRSDVDAHRHTLPDELDLILSEQYCRKISKNLEISFQNTIYQINTKTQGYTMRGANLLVCVDTNDHISLLYKDKTLPYTMHQKQKTICKIATSKEINPLIDSLKSDGRTRGHRSPANHPWRTPKPISQTAPACTST